jgi:hypothetical protein
MFKNENGSCYYRIKKIKYDFKFLFLKRTKQIGYFKAIEDINYTNKIQISENQVGESFPPKQIGTYYPPQGVILNNIIAYNLKKTRILLNTNAVYMPVNNTLFYEKWHDKKDELVFDYSSKSIIKHNLDQVRFNHKKADKKIENGIFLGCTFITNYYHFLLEMVARVAYLHVIPNAENIPILISDKVLEIESFKNIIEIFFKNYQIKYLNDNYIYEVNDLWYLTSPNTNLPNIKYGNKFELNHTKIRLESVQYIRKNSIDYVSDLSLTVKNYSKIFIKRKSDIRSFNQDEIINCAINYGFNCVFFEDLNFMEQVTIMQHADYVIGATGAAWTNLIFAKEGAKGLIWMGSNWGNVSMFSTLAKMVNFDLNYIIFDSLTVDYHEKFELDLNLFENNLKMLLTQN